ncbi:MAG TPA: putative toxin-antitoxin system toxin component, PIN family [Vicinamibacteria bacterium]
MRVVLDTNVLIAAFLTQGTCHELLEYIIRNHSLIASTFILDELKDRLSSKFHLTREEVHEAVGLIAERAEVVRPAKVNLPVAIDPDDSPVLGTAIAGQCRCLVTGDKELLSLKTVEGVYIISPSSFWRFEDSYGAD